MEQMSFTPKFWVKHAKMTFLKKNLFWVHFFIELKCRWLQVGLAHLKNTKLVELFLREYFQPIFKFIAFFILMWPVTRKGTSWVSYSEIHFFRFLNREFYDESRNINMLVGSWSFWVSKCPKKMGTALKRHKLSIDVIVTLLVHHKIQQIDTRYKILQKDITMY